MLGKLPTSILKQVVIPPASVAKEASKGLLLRKKFKRGGTAIGLRRAIQLSKRSPVSIDTVKRMHSFFSRHAVDRRPGWDNPLKPSNGYIAWLLWGGDAGWDWALRVLKSSYRAAMFADVLRSLGQTEIPDIVWASARSYDSDTSFERMKQLFMKAMDAQDYNTGTKTKTRLLKIRTGP